MEATLHFSDRVGCTPACDGSVATICAQTPRKEMDQKYSFL